MKTLTHLNVILSIMLMFFIANLKAQSPPVASFTVNQTSGCSPLAIQFRSTSANTTSYYWDFGNGNFSFLKNPVNVFFNPGTYTIKFIATSEEGQKDSITVYNWITVLPGSVSDFFVEKPTAPLDGNAFSFINTSLNFTNCIWDFGDGNTSTIQNPTHHYATQGDYTIKLITQNGGGCLDTKIAENYIHVTANPISPSAPDTTSDVKIITEAFLYIPNAFSPNGDGVNDSFGGKGEGITVYNIQIFNRWGNLIFESNDIKIQWDGSYHNEMAPEGVYVYKVNAIGRGADGKSKKLISENGKINLVL